MEASPFNAKGGRSVLERSPLAALPDRLTKWFLTGLAALILVIIAFFFIRLISESHLAFQKFGVFGFVFDNNWDVSANYYGALPLVVGTIITAVIGLVIGVPVAVSSALYITELCPRALRGPLTLVLELLAAVPSVVYGVWGVVFLIPHLKGAQQWFADTFSFLPFIGGHVAGPSYFIAGLILAIMVIPIVSAISREVMSTVPVEHKEAALALGATRWEMIKMSVVPYSRAGITGASMLGLGRALGETIAVTLVIGNSPVLGHQLFDQGYTLAAVIANEFQAAGEGQPLHRSALIAAGLVLFLMTLVVNAGARYFVARAENQGGGLGVKKGQAAAARVAAPGAGA